MKVLRDAFAAAMQDESVRSQLESFGITPSFVDEAELVAELNRVREEVKPLVAKVKEAAQ
jgi:tripartite-type tricarboxylate transporter receptor subunit TctC